MATPDDAAERHVPRALHALVEDLSEPRAYPHAVPDEVVVCQTHLSVVFLAGNRAYKVKKAVAFPFVDYSTLARRRHYCLEEVRLNRRLAPDVYLDVVPVTRERDRLRVGGDAAPVEWAVAMRRLPADRSLAAALRTGTLAPPVVTRLARRLAEFHADCTPAPAGSPFGSPRTIASALGANLRAVTGAGHRVVRDGERRGLVDAARLLLKDATPLLQHRFERGVVRECHGDLRLDHVYHFPDAPAPADLIAIDGIEFDDGLRYIDPCDDAAFLVMDLAAQDHGDLAARFADAWLEAAGDADGAALLPLYVFNRALVRAKVEALQAHAPGIPPAARTAAQRRARRYVQYLLELVHGSPATARR